MTDASSWLPLTPLERRSLALDGIARMYQNQWDGDKKIDVHDLLIETSDAVWSESTATGDAMFLPGQFRTRFDVARQPEGNVYFAGEHLSYHHTWISGAANSALKVVRDMLGKQNLSPLEAQDTSSTKEYGLNQPGGAKNLWVTSEPVIRDEALVQDDIKPDIPHPAKVPFEFRPNNPMFGKHHPGPSRRWPPVGAPETPGQEYKFPTHLGMSGTILGADTTSLKALNATEL